MAVGLCAPLVAGEPTVRVGVLVGISAARVGVDGGGACRVSDGIDADVVRVSSGGTIPIVWASSEQVRIGNRRYRLPCTVEPLGDARTVVRGRRYDGTWEVRAAGKGGFSLINVLPVERYLCGVLPYEIAPEWSDEMLKVQAIAARTWVIANRGRHGAQGYDVCTGVHCQVYRGISRRLCARVDRAVQATRGYVIVDARGEPILAYYHAACGGSTEDADAVWGAEAKRAYLVGSPCPHCAGSPYRRWTFTVSADRFSQALRRVGAAVGTVRDVRVSSTSVTGRALWVRVRGTMGQATVPARALRRILGVNRFRSTRVSRASVTGAGVTFTGSGWGHGVGLCQWGAEHLTREGATYDAVLRYYYPGTRLRKQYE